MWIINRSFSVSVVEMSMKIASWALRAFFPVIALEGRFFNHLSYREKKAELLQKGVLGMFELCTISWCDVNIKNFLRTNIIWRHKKYASAMLQTRRHEITRSSKARLFSKYGREKFEIAKAWLFSFILMLLALKTFLWRKQVNEIFHLV